MSIGKNNFRKKEWEYELYKDKSLEEKELQLKPRIQSGS